MRNLLVFLWKYNFFILFLLFEVLSGFLIYENSDFHQANMINSANNVAATIQKTVWGVTEYLRLKETYEDLAKENAELKSKLSTSFYGDTAKMRTAIDSVRKQKYIFLSAKVISNSTIRRNNYLTLDKGSADGVKHDMGVVSATGIVGIVKDVSEHFCTVTSFLHKESKISVKLKKNNYFGAIVWKGGDAGRATLLHISKHVPLAKGDTLVTSSYSRIFPEGIVCGIVTDFELQAGENSFTGEVRLTEDFGKLTQVYIIGNLMKEEQKNLEAPIENAN